jgi:hypothetical protein
MVFNHAGMQGRSTLTFDAFVAKAASYGAYHGAAAFPRTQV